MRLKALHFVVLIAVALAIAACGKHGYSPIDGAASQTVVDSSDATQSSLEMSGGADGSAPLFAAAGPIAGSCDPIRTVVSTAMVCAFSYPSQVHLEWNCATAGGAQVVGTADVSTTVTSTSCPATSLSITRAIAFDRTRSKAGRVANLAGTANIDWTATPGTPGAQKHLVYSLEKRVNDGATLVLQQQLSGDKTVDFLHNAAEEKKVTGSEEVKHLLAGFDFVATESNLDYQRSCCYPLSGTFAFTETGSRTESGTITFGPSCGAAVDNSGGAIVLPACN